jgi:SAM-dependent methyltransferase
VNSRYDNTSYWRELHARYPGELRAVGHPWLSEAANRLKYESEAESLAHAFRIVLKGFSGRRSLDVLDVGAGTGFWTTLVSDMLRRHEIDARVSVLDISDEALASLAERMKGIHTIRADLKCDAPGANEGSYDLVTAMYCLHHLARRVEFANGLRYAAICVRSNGYLVVMDPILREGYSPFREIDEATWSGNGMPRSLEVIDRQLSELGLRRVVTRPAVSFLLNGPVEAAAKRSFAVRDALWRAATRLLRHQTVTRLASPALRYADRGLKALGLSGSSSICIYRKDS